MSYALSLSPLAEQQLAAHPSPLREFIRTSLQGLAESPTAHGRRSASFALGQLAEFKFDREGATVWVTITFLYGQDEQTLHIEHIAVEFGG